MLNSIKKEELLIKRLMKVVFLLFILIIIYQVKLKNNLSITEKYIKNFSTIFTSIIIESMPFIMLGSILSAIIQVCVSEENIIKIIPRNKFLGIFIASIIGIIFPVCECGIIPIATKLIKKGVPKSIAITFMLAVPIINPITIIATYYAFTNKPEVIYIRCIYGIVNAMLIGYVISIAEEDTDILNEYNKQLNTTCICGCENNLRYHIKSKLSNIINHTSTEFYKVGKYLIIGALLSLAFQVFVNKNVLVIAGQHYIMSIFVMMLMAYALSICSSADAFIAKAFLNQFTLGSIVTFLLFGPMLDIKNTIMLLGNFKKKFVLKLIFFICIFNFIAGCLINFAVIFGVI